MQAIRMEGGLVKTISEIVYELCQLLTRPLYGRLALQTFLRLSAFMVQLLSSWKVGSEDNLEVVAEPATACKLSSRKVGCEDHP